MESNNQSNDQTNDLNQQKPEEISSELPSTMKESVEKTKFDSLGGTSSGGLFSMSRPKDGVDGVMKGVGNMLKGALGGQFTLIIHYLDIRLMIFL